LLQRSGIKLIKYWFSVSAEEQERRFQSRIHNTTKRWKISPMDLESRNRWVDYSRAKDTMMEYTDTKLSPWYVVPSDDKKAARLNCIRHLLSQFDYQDVVPGPIELPERPKTSGYVRPPRDEQTYVPNKYEPVAKDDQ
jgi:polyphosphate kinase 2 (PPK2 family)